MLFYRVINPCLFFLFIMIRNVAVQSKEYFAPKIINSPSVLQSYTLSFPPCLLVVRHMGSTFSIFTIKLKLLFLHLTQHQMAFVRVRRTVL